MNRQGSSSGAVGVGRRRIVTGHDSAKVNHQADQSRETGRSGSSLGMTKQDVTVCWPGKIRRVAGAEDD